MKEVIDKLKERTAYTAARIIMNHGYRLDRISDSMMEIYDSRQRHGRNLKVGDLGITCFNGVSLNVNHWSLMVYGIDNVPKLRALAEELSAVNGVRVSLVLSRFGP